MNAEYEERRNVNAEYEERRNVNAEYGERINVNAGYEERREEEGSGRRPSFEAALPTLPPLTLSNK